MRLNYKTSFILALALLSSLGVLVLRGQTGHAYGKFHAQGKGASTSSGGNNQTFFSDDFEGGSVPGAWDSMTPSSPIASGGVYITSDAGQVYGGTYGAKITYIYNSPGVHYGLDHYLQKLWSAGAIPDHFFMRGYVKFHVNSSPFQGDAWIQRKVFYINATLSNTWFFVLKASGSSSPGYWGLISGYSGWGTDNEPDTQQDRTGATMWPSSTGTYDSVARGYDPDFWYYWEVEVQLNTPGQTDGYMKLWIQKIGVDSSPVLIIQTYNSSLRGSWSTTLTRLDLGEQADDSNGVINEERYIDNFKLTNFYIGP